MKLNSYRLIPAGWNEPDLPNLCGPLDLVTLLLEGREYTMAQREGDRGWLAPLSDDGLRRLVELAYYTSLASEERRFPRFTLVCLESDPSLFVTAFDSAIPVDDLRPLRRLAPACLHQNCALSIQERDGRLWCTGIVDIGPHGHDTRPGYPVAVPVGSGPKLKIRVEGPGHLIASESLIGPRELKWGKIRQVVPIWGVPGIKEFASTFASETAAEIRPTIEPKYHGLFGGDFDLWRMCLQTLSTFLKASLREEHGGSIIILPDSGDDLDRFNILAGKYRAKSLDLRQSMIDLCLACVRVGRATGREDVLQESQWWQWARVALQRNSEALGHLSCVDGCVVLNRHLRLCAFGAFIDVSDEKSKEVPSQFQDAWTDEVIPYEAFMNGIGGTRHQSAARLCKAHDGVTAIVMSQDGDLKVFYSRDHKVYGFGSVDPDFLLE